MEILIALAVPVVVLTAVYTLAIAGSALMNRLSRRSYVRGILRNVEIRGRFDSEERSL
ncbi:membrane protein [Microbacterium phage Cece]|nr:membrane protein [Microbacterium phage Cece]UVG35345.1 membrane protein [Microbacterium phage Cece]